MKQWKKAWVTYSLQKKLVSIFTGIIIVMALTEGIVAFTTQLSLNDFGQVIEDNSKYHELQEAIENEQETFTAYMRSRSQENRLLLEEACRQSEACIQKLEFSYEDMGEERYARTWNLINGYEGYKEYRNRLLEKKETDEDYIKELYKVQGMQDNLSASVLRLIQETLTEWDAVYDERMQFLSRSPLLIIFVSLLLLFITLAALQVISRTIVKPILLIAEDSRKIAVNDFDTPEVQVENEDEISELVVAFQKMKRAMKEHIKTLEEKNRMEKLLHEKELEELEIELAMLKHQMNPHFLFNTLNMINSMASLEDAETTGKMIGSLAYLLRYNLHTVEQEVSLEQELQAVDDYMYIQEMRFGDRISYIKQISEEVLDMDIPSFSLQPLVENACIHGISSREEGGKIVLKAWKKQNHLVITVADDGDGMDEEKLESLNQKIHQKNTSGRGIGLGNICRRIDGMYEDGVFEVFSKKDKGTIIWMEIPQDTKQKE